MPFQIFHVTRDRAEWDALHAALPADQRDVHHTAAYCAIQDPHAILAAFTTEAGSFVMQPFVMREVQGARDLCSPYGYGGPVGMGDAAGSFLSGLTEWANDNRVVAEFCALHPLIDQPVAHPFEDVSKKLVAVINLEGKADLSRRIERGVRRAEERGHKVVEGTQEGFAALYRMSMIRLHARADWHKGTDYWDAHVANDVGARWFYVVDPDGGRHRALLTIGKGATAYAHFLGSDGELRRDGLDEMLYMGAAAALRASGFKTFHLGGGTSDLAMDPLLAFKLGFTNKTLMARRIGRVFSPNDYLLMVKSKMDSEAAEHGRHSTAQWFPLYRRPFT